RVLLVAVPYALKASDSDTLGGKPASAYALAGAQTLLAPPTVPGSSSSSSAAAQSSNPTPGGAPTAPQPGATCSSVTSDSTATANSITMFTAACNLEASAITQTSGNIGISGASPAGTKFQITDTPAADFGVHYTNHELLNSSVTKNGTNKGLTFVMDLSNTTIPAGVTDSGYRVGVEGAGYANTAGFAGTLGAQYGVWGRAGIAGGTAGAAVTNAYAGYFDIFNAVAGTTITNAYGVYIANSATTGTITNRYDLYASSANAKSYFAGNVGIGTTTPGANLEIVGNVKVSGGGHGITFPDGSTQTTANLPGSGTITGVTAGTDLTGGGTSGKVTLNLDTTQVPTLGAASNTFTGDVAAGSFKGDGSGLTKVNANKLGGVLAANYARVDVSNNFAADQAVTGNFSATGNISAGGTVEVDSIHANTGASGPGLTFAGGGETIISNRNSGTNQYGLDFFTNYTPRMSITNSGQVGIGTQNPGSMIEADVPSQNYIQGGLFTGGTTSTSGGADGVVGLGGNDNTTGGQPTGYYAGAGGVFFGGNSANSYAGDGVVGYPGTNSYINTYAGNFQGNLYVSGAITAGTKDFLIDHPLDPANKYLYHSSVESSEMMNIYTGNVITDASGDAVVKLPEWFETLNRDFRYQLTVIGQFAQAIVASEISNHQFSIKTDKPNVRVSWQVTGVRQDAYANAHPLEVEVAKSDRERGYYIHPELYGAPEEKGIEWARRPEMMKRMKEHRARQQQTARLAPATRPQ
ncbi:MAG: hypothetical protein ACLQOO_26985, partial [Terriglobia bacterium]